MKEDIEIKNNPFFQDFGNKYNAIPFDKIKIKHFVPAIKEGIKEAKENLKSIKNNPETPNFNNTILALETSSERLDIIDSVFSILSSAESNDEMDELAEKTVNSMIAKFINDLYLDEDLFLRVKTVYQNCENSGFNPEQVRLTEYYYKQFIRNGVLLSEKKKARIRKIDKELSKLCSKFGANDRKSTNDFELVITDKKRLSGLPETVLERAGLDAEERGKPKGSYLFTLHEPSVFPVLEYADDRSLRTTMTKALYSVALGGKFDNQEIIKKIVEIRYERANLLGYKTHAEYVLDNRMAENPERVWGFLDEMYAFAKPAAEKDLKELENFAKEIDGIDTLQKWDIRYYSEKLKNKKFDFDNEKLRPYFMMGNVIKGMFSVAEKLYGLKFSSVKIPVYHKNVKTYEVKDKNNNYLGLLYLDLFPRKTKKSGGWSSPIKEQGLLNGKIQSTHVSIVCNFTEPSPTKPSLLTFQEVETFFHEFGHALHCLLSNCTYQSLSGYNVLWDFVELPSQIMENWIKEKECLDIFAVHYKTKEKISDEIIEKIKQAETFMSGLIALRQVELGYLDMHWYTENPNEINNVVEFEQKAVGKTQLLPVVPEFCFSCSFGHIFGGGYSAGYYSYKWAEVLEADAFELFKENGLFNEKVAESFRKNILSRGNTEHPMELYKRFRGREPKIDALLKRSGLLNK